MSDSRHIDNHRSRTAQHQNVSVRREGVVTESGYGLLPHARPIVVVLGMHRSGTSLLSNMLHILGVDMADTTDHVSPKNPGGFWERPELVAIHDEILEAIGRPIALPSHVLPFPPAWWRSKQVQALKPKLVEFVRRELAKSPNPWGFKDPRTCRLLPLWWEVFRELNLEPIYINAVRAPSEAAVSMSQKSSARKLSVANSELMWLSYNYDAARYVTLKSRAILVDYAEWFADPNAVAQRLCEDVGIGQDLSPADIAECVASIVQADYRHQFAESADSGSLASMFYKSLIASNPLEPNDMRGLRGQIRLVEMFFKSVAPIVHDLDAGASDRASLEAEHDELAQELAAETSERKILDSRLHRHRKRARALLRKARDRRNSYLQELARHATAAEALQSEITELQSRLAAHNNRLQRERKRSGALLRKAQEWRNTYIAEHGEPDERLAAAAQLAELLRALSSAQRRLATAEEERARFVAELEMRDLALAQLRREQPLRPQVNSEERVFTWPTDGLALEISGGIDRVDPERISGHVVVAGRADIVPVVEVRVDDSFVTAQSCLAGQMSSGPGYDGRWHFSLPWDRFSPEHAGKEAVLVIAGTELQLGTAAIPTDLRIYHRSPAARAAAEIGGTVEEAAEYHRWLIEREAPDDADLARAYRADTQTAWPVITIIVCGNGEAKLRLTLQSLQSQIYAEWQALCVDTPLAASDVDPRIRMLNASDLDAAIAEKPADALFTFIEAGDLMHPTALLHLAEEARTKPDFALVYSDEDLMDPFSGLRAVPHMKGAWSPDLALAQDYVSRLALVRRSSLDAKAPVDAAGVYELTLRAALSGAGPVIHLPFVLYHRAAENAPNPQHFAEAVHSVIESIPALSGAKVISDTEGRTKVEWPLPEPEPRVSLIVPTRDRADLLRVCVSGFLHETHYQNLEVLIADNESQEDETKVYLEKISTHPRVRVIPCPGPFNFSKINNIAAAQATGELIGLMNNDLRVLDPKWLQAMVRHAVRPDVGIVGAKLLYEDGTIQHAGVTLGIALASHIYKFAAGDAEGRQRRLSLTQDVSAVTAACLLMRRDVWDEVGGLDEAFPVAYNDVDLCLKVRAAGYRILWTPDAVLYHLESRSRGKDVTSEKRERLDRDKARLIDRWGELLSSDPFHSPNLSASHTDARLSFPPRATTPWQPAIAAQ